jgi:hypothetical protein
VPALRLFSATMVASSITPAPTLSSSPMAPISAYHAHTPRLRTVKPSGSFVPLIILSAPFCSRPACLQPIGSKLSTPPQLFSTSYPPKHCGSLRFSIPHQALFGAPPAYDHLRVFGCRCYPNLSATATHKLAPRSILCVFFGYSAHHKGYRYLDLSSHKVIISRHVTFDENVFLFSEWMILSF